MNLSKKAKKAGEFILLLSAFKLFLLFVVLCIWVIPIREVQAQGTFGYRKTITVNSGRVQNGPLSHFPMLVRVTDPNLRTIANGGRVASYDAGNNDPRDIIFRALDSTTCGGTAPCGLDHEIEKYDASTGELVAWVRVPSINNGTAIYIYYGNSSITASTQNETGVWNENGANNYKGVWHLKEDPSGGSPQMKDSTSNVNDGSSGGSMTSGDQVVGNIDGSLDFDGTNDYINFGHQTSLDLTSKGTLSAWVKFAADPHQYSYLVGKSSGGNQTVQNYLMAFANYPTDKRIRVKISDGTNYNQAYTATTTWTPGTWYYIVGEWDGTKLQMYVNGQPDGASVSQTMNAWVNSAFNVQVGCGFDTGCTSSTNAVNGVEDEVRVSNIDRSPDWIKTEYNNQSSPSTFYTYGVEQDLNFNYQYRKRIAIPRTTIGSSCSSDISNFPFLISVMGDPNLKTITNGGHVQDTTHNPPYDIIFKASDGTQLDHEIEKYDGTNGHGDLVAWVRIPKLSYDSDTVIYMYYGNSSITSPTANPTGVWDSSFIAVWHLKESPTDAAPQFKDSTLHGNHGTAQNATYLAQQAGQINGSIHFNNYPTVNNAYITTNTGASVRGLTQYTISAWVYPEVSAAQRGLREAIYEEPVGTSTNTRAKLNLRGDSPNADKFNLYGRDLDGGAGTTWAQAANPITFPNSTWYYVVGVFDSVTDVHRIWYNGIDLTSAVTANTISGTAPFAAPAIGTNVALTEFWLGTIDELRISAVARDACWIGTEYNNQNLLSGSISVGSEETNSNNYQYRKQINIDRTKLGSSCTPGLNTWQISANSRDAWDDMTASSNINQCIFGDYTWSDAGGYQWAVTIPKGATITSARIRVYSTGHVGAAGSYTARIRIEDVDNASAFTGAANNIYGRTYWGTTVDWTIPAGGLPTNTWSNSPDITSLIQHIVNRPGWSSGNYLSIAVWGQTSSGSGSYENINDYNTNPSLAAQLEVTYETITNFPVLINIPSDNDLKTTANGGHVQDTVHNPPYDITFRASDGVTQLDHEVERYTPTTGELVAWVRIPTLSLSNDTVIYMYYGNSAITLPTASPTGVWDANYKGVWHLKEATNTTRMDSTSNHNDLTDPGAGGGVALDTAAKIAGAASFSLASSQYLYKIDGGVGSSLDITGPITIEAWVKLATSQGTPSSIAVKSRGTCGTSGSEAYWLRVNTGNPPRGNVGVRNLCAGTTNQVNGTGVDTVNWWYLAGVNDGTNVVVYTNGVAGSTAAGWSTVYDSDGELRVGMRQNDQYINGLIDELRISSGVRDACWIGTEYNNQNSPSTFYSIGSEGSTAPTAVKFTSFTATQYSDGVLLRWRTGYEVDNLGFHLYREENDQLVRLTPEPVAGSALVAGSRTALTAGRHYSWWDFPTLATRPSSLATLKYWLEDIDLSGKRTMHGPVFPILSQEHMPKKVNPELLSELGIRLEERYHQYWKVRELKEKIRSRGLRNVKGPLRSRSLRTGNKVPLRAVPKGLEVGGFHRHPDLAANEVQKYLAGKPAVKLFVKEEGWHRVSQAELVAAGLNSKVNPQFLQLFVDGKEQPIQVTGKKNWDGIEFYGVGLDTPSTDTRVYWLIEGPKPGKRIYEFKGYSSSLGSLSSSSFPYTVEVKDRWIYLPAIKNGEEENFFGSVVYGAGVDQLLQVRHLDPGASEDALLEVVLQGATNVSHRVKVLLNREEVEEVTFEGQSKGLLQVEVPQSLLLEDDNLVSLVPLGGDMDVSLVDSIRLTYWHTYMVDKDGLRFTAQGGDQLSIGGFGSSGIRVFDITEPAEVIEVSGRVQFREGSYAVSFRVPGTGQRTLLALTEERVKNPEGMTPNQPSSWHQSRDGYDLVMITHRDFIDTLQPLKQLRETQGLKVALIDVEDLYDEFSFGNKSPKAMKDFLASAKSKWQRPPRFVLLVGDASFDPKNYFGLGDLDFVPTKLIDTVYLETASDDWFVDFNSDGLPDMAIGRLPVQTKDEAAIVVSKVIGYEKSSKKNEALLIADLVDNTDDFNFEGASEEIRALLPSSLVVRKIYRSQFSSDSQVNGVLLGAINQGPLLVNFIGHGSIEIWRGNIFTSDDADTLINGYRLPFFVNMTCLNGYFQDPYSETLGEALIKAKGGGAIAIWASSGLTEPDKQALMNKELIRLLFGTGPITLGEATAKAKASVSDQDIRRTWILFGDPSTRLRTNNWNIGIQE